MKGSFLTPEDIQKRLPEGIVLVPETFKGVTKPATFIDKEYGEFVGIVRLVTSRQKRHPARKRLPHSTPEDIQKRLPEYLTLVKHTYKGWKHTAVFIDRDYGEFEGLVCNVVAKNKHHPNRAKEIAAKKRAPIDQIIKDLDILNQSMANSDNCSATGSAIITIKPETYRGKKSIATFIDSEYGEFTGCVRDVLSGAKKHPDRAQAENNNIKPIDEVIKKLPDGISIKRDTYKGMSRPAIMIDEQYGEFEASPTSVIYSGKKHPERIKENIKKARMSLLEHFTSRMPEGITMVPETFKAGNQPATFIDSEYGEFTGLPSDVILGKKIHPARKGLKKRLPSNEILKRLPEYITFLGETPVMSEQGTFFNSRCGHTFTTTIGFVARGVQCNKCHGSSKGERDLYAWVQTYCPDALYRHKVGGVEADIVVPSKKIAIEFNGAYWHSHIYKSNNFHRDKTEHFNANGFTLIHVWEHEWKYKSAQIKSYLRSKLGSNLRRVFARKCIIKTISYQIASDFLNRYHIRGSFPKSLFIAAFGLFNRNELLAVVTVGKHHRNSTKGLLINRVCFAEGVLVHGGLAKICKHAAKTLGCDLYTFVDLSKSNGKSYSKAGFVLDKKINPDYFYCSQVLCYVSKQARAKNKVGTPKGMTEFEHAELDGLLRVYDCGKLRLRISP